MVHVSWNNTSKFCRWAGKRLTMKAEGQVLCQHLDGEVPAENTAEEGFAGTCPVGEFPENAFGLKNMVGNVWEWTSDWWTIRHSSIRIQRGQSKSGTR